MSFKSPQGREVDLELIADEVARRIYNNPEIADMLEDHPLRDVLDEDGVKIGETRQLKIFHGSDQLKMPTEKETPFCMIFKQSRGFGTQGSTNPFTLVVHLAVKAPKDGSQEHIDPDTGIITYKTSKMCSDVGESIVRSLEDRENPFCVELMMGELNIYEDYYPLYVAELLLQFNTYKLIGGRQTIGSK